MNLFTKKRCCLRTWFLLKTGFNTHILFLQPSQWEKYDLGLDVLVRLTPLLKQGSKPLRGGGGIPIGKDARRKLCTKPLKETNLGVAQPFFDP